MSHQPYDDLFYEYQCAGSLRSARGVVPVLRGALPIDSVLDVGCGVGTWIKAHLEAGASEFLGVDGDYVDRSRLVMPADCFRAHDLTRPLDLGRRFDLVQCLEVAEHLPPSTSTELVKSLARHGDIVLFSAAPPGQGGKDHVNERTYEFWRDEFARQRYALFDYVRRVVAGREDIEPWYRYNMLLFVHEARVPHLHADIQGARVPQDDPVPDPSPVAYRMRKMAVRCLPRAIVSAMVVYKHRRIVKRLRDESTRVGSA